MEKNILCGIECGGTTHKVAFANSTHQNIISSHTIQTESPAKVWEEIVQLIRKFEATNVCVASFGPVILKGSCTGRVISYTKPGWEDFNIYTYILENTDITPNIIHDCQAGAFAELINSNKPKRKILYVTIGTGIGIGLVENGNIIKDNRSLEAGHSFIRIREGDDFEGACKIHGNCLEGLANATAIAKRLGFDNIRKLQAFNENHDVWELAGYYVAMFVYNSFLTLLPESIVLGGGISNNKRFVESVKYNFNKINNNYIGKEYGFEKDIIKTSTYGTDQGIMGCLYYMVANEKLFEVRNGK